MRRFFKGITIFEWLIWGISTVSATVCFFVFGNTNYHYLIGAVIGFTALLLVSKGNPAGQVLCIVFSVFYGVVSYSYRYYGEMITYLGMSAPMVVAALVMWLKNPYKGNKSEVKVNVLKKREWAIFAFLVAAVTAVFFFILRALGTANLIISTLSVATSFSAVYLTARRNRFYAVGYALNDVVLIALWSLAAKDDITYLPMAVCFAAFLAIDIYGFINWTKMTRRQRTD